LISSKKNKVKKRILLLCGLTLILFYGLFSPVDWQSFEGSTVHRKMMNKLDSLPFETTVGDTELSVGWAKSNITPNFPVSLVGYQPRGPHTSVHDSLFLSVMCFDNKKEETFVLTADLLLFPPYIKERLELQLPKIGIEIEQIYFAATHTHTSYGGWDKRRLGKFITGNYDAKVISLLVNKTLETIVKAKENKARASIGFKKIYAPYVENRVDGLEGKTDDYLRVVKVKKVTGEVGLLISYAAHPTSISKKLLSLSSDYPGLLVKKLEEGNCGVDFSMFCAGMVGSLRPKEKALDKRKNFKLIHALSHRLYLNIVSEIDSIPLKKTGEIGLTKIPLFLPKPQFRVSRNWRLRSWVFESALGELEGEIAVLQLGGVTMIGMPCDYSGEVHKDNELDVLAKQNGVDLMITSFNGSYIGYINADKYYHTKKKEEVVVLNWVGPYKGRYFAEITQKVIFKTGDNSSNSP